MINRISVGYVEKKARKGLGVNVSYRIQSSTEPHTLEWLELTVQRSTVQILPGLLTPVV